MRFTGKNIAFIGLALLFFALLPYCYLYASGQEPVQDLTSRMAVLVFELSVIVCAAWLGGKIFEKLNIPGVLGELCAGIIIGPYLLGGIPFWGFPQGLFPLSLAFPISHELYGFTVIASIVLLFLVGLETDLETFLSFSFAGSVVGVGGVIVSFMLGDLVGVLASPYLFGTQYGFMHPIPLFLGVISTATSVGITARVLSGRRKMDSPEGVTIISGAVIDDILGIIALAIVIGIIKIGHVSWRNVTFITLKALAIWLGFTAIGLGFSQSLSRFLKNIKDRRAIAVISFALALFVAGVFERSGLAMIIGAYIMGLSLSKTDLAYEIQENLTPLYRFFVPIFFCVMGMLVDIRVMFSSKIFLFGLVYFVFAVLGKIIGCGIPALFANFNLRGAMRVSMGMIPRGEVALIMAGIGLSVGVLSQEIFSIAVIMTFGTTLIAPYILARMFDQDKPVLRKAQPAKVEHEQIVYTMPNIETAEMLLSKVLRSFDDEGFYIHRMEFPDRLYQIRKDEIFITLKYNPQELVFDCLLKDAHFVHTLFYEVLADLERTMKHLQNLTDREKIGKSIFADTKLAKKERLQRIPQIIGPLAVKANLQGTTKHEIIEELMDLLIKSGQLRKNKYETALKDLLEREASMTTGMQDGIALPHAKTSAVRHLVSAVGIKKEGIDFDSLDKKPCNIFVITLAPKAYPEPYLEFMAEVTKFLMIEENRKKILSAETDMELYKAFT